MKRLGATAADVFAKQIQAGGGELDVSALLGPPPKEKAADTWLTPAAADLKYRHVWIARTKGGGPPRMVIVIGYRRRKGSRRSWYGTDLRTRRQVWITSVLKGSEI